MKPVLFLSLFVIVVLNGCSISEITLPPTGDEANLINTVPILKTTMKNMEGIYTLSDGNDALGTEFVCKVSRYKLSFFSNQNGIYMILKYGLNPVDNSIQFAGFWRYSENTSQGLINFSIAANQGGSDLLANGIANNIVLSGMFINAANSAHPLKLSYKRAFTTFAKTNEFMVFGHHGIQTTAHPPYAENSINAIKYAEDYGNTGMEVDVRMTKDNVPILIHDDAINTRLTKKGPLAGSYDQYNYAFLHQYVELIDGQKIPSVEQALRVFIDSTDLKYIWFDIKGNENIFKYMEPVVRDAYARAATVGRDVVIFAGLPSDDVIEEFRKQPSYSAPPNPLPTLSEVSMDDVIANKSSFFGPRFSEGLLLPDVDLAHSMGVKVISWTLNDRNIIKNYLENGKFDGFITDYPAYVVYNYYTLY